MKTEHQAAEDCVDDRGRFEANAILFVGGELCDAGAFETTLRDDAARRGEIDGLAALDAMLRGAAEAERPGEAEMRRSREAALRFARTRAVATIERSALYRPARQRRVPRWSLAAAAAALAIIGFAGWISNAGPRSLPSMATTVTPAATSADDANGGRPFDRQQFVSDLENYGELIPAFTPIEPQRSEGTANDLTASTVDGQDEAQTQVDALTMLGTMASE